MAHFRTAGIVWLFLVSMVSPGLAIAAEKEETAVEAGGAAVLDAKSLWRCRIINGSIPIKNGTGKVEYLFESTPWTGREPKVLRKTTRVRFRPDFPSDDWPRPDFNDSDWGLARGPFSGSRVDRSGGGNLNYRVRTVYLRGRFAVQKPAQMNLSFTFSGGVVAYLNGTEIGRSHLPNGKLTHGTFAEDYPKEAYFCPKGKLLVKTQKKYPDRYKLRLRELKIDIPASSVRKGVNVLALELRCAPANPDMFLAKDMRAPRKHSWPRVGLDALTLTTADKSTVATSVPKAFRVWNHSILQRLHVSSQGNTLEPLRPISMVGARNGVFSGQVVAGSTSPIKGLKAVAGDLKGPGGAVIPATAVEIRYPLPDGPWPKHRSGIPYFDSLEEFPPDEVPVFQKTDRVTKKPTGTPVAVQPVWFTVRVPENAKPGSYSGRVAISAQGAEPVEVPINLKVVDWVLPDSKDFTYHTDLIQSPDTVARKYGVKMWSEEHWKLVERSVDLLGQLGNKVLYIPLIAKTHFGNEHSMVRWIQEEGGGYSHDFSIVKRYVDMVVKHQGKVPVVCLYCWEPAKVGLHWKHGNFMGERDVMFSVMDPQTEKLEVKEGPKWGTSECRQLLKPAFKGVMKILKKKGLAKSVMVGICNDFAPSPDAIKTIDAVAPKHAKWVVHSHGRWTTVPRTSKGRPVEYGVFVWFNMVDPADSDNGKESRWYGWRTPSYRMVKFSRGNIWMWQTPCTYRVYPQIMLLEKGKYKGDKWHHGSQYSGVIGFGREGADFWDLPRENGRPYTLVGFYNPWGGLDIRAYGLNYVLGPGKNGTVPTVRYEMFRESIQECEARFHIERALLDPAKRAKLGEKRAVRLQEMLDECARANIAGYKSVRWLLGSDWQARSEELYRAAGEAEKALR